jgi:hypothetical protein
LRRHGAGLGEGDGGGDAAGDACLERREGLYCQMPLGQNSGLELRDRVAPAPGVKFDRIDIGLVVGFEVAA